MKSQKKNIIIEKYNPGIGLFTSWNAERFTKTATKIILKNVKGDELADNLDNVLVPKKWFKWEPVFTELKEDQIEIVGAGIKSGCKATITYNYELKDDEFRGLIYGDEEDEKYGGLIYNKEFEGMLKDVGISAPTINSNDEDDDLEDDDIDTESTDLKLFKAYKNVITEQVESLKMTVQLKLKIVMEPGVIQESKVQMPIVIEQNDEKSGAKPKAEAGPMKPKDYLNPNYITSMKGNIVLRFGEGQPKTIGEITIDPKRTKDMDRKPKFSFGQAMKNLWNDTMDKPNDFGIAGVAAKKMIGSALGAGMHKLTDGFKTIQKRRIDATIFDKFNYTNNFKNSEDRENEVDDTETERNDDAYKANVQDKIEKSILSINDSLDVIVNGNEDKGGQVNVTIKNASGMKLLMFTFKYD